MGSENGLDAEGMPPLQERLVEQTEDSGQEETSQEEDWE